jgi:hypothetical protein
LPENRRHIRELSTFSRLGKAGRRLMHEAALTADEDRVSLLYAVCVIRRKLPACGVIPPAENLLS